MNIHVLTLKHRLFIAGVCFSLVVGLFAGQVNAATTDAAQAGRLVTFHDRGETKVILTYAQNVRDALADASISVVDQDTIEPGIDEQLIATNYTVNIYRARPVIVVDGAVRAKVMTAAQTADAIADSVGIILHDEDRANLAQSSDIVADGAGDVLTIDRATEFNLTLYGKKITAYSHESTVGAMLKQKGIELGPSDDLSVPFETPLVNGLDVALWRNGIQTVTVEEAVSYPVRKVQDFDHPLGYHQIQTAGVDGQRSVTYEINMRDGKEIGRKEIQSVVLQKPKEQVEIVGAAPPPGSHQDWMAAAGIAASDFGYVSYIVDHENRSWDPCKIQGGAVDCTYDGSGFVGYGLVQATPGNKMSSAGSDWQTNPITQLKWASQYAVGRYGSWKNAYLYWLDHHNW